jgi:hypothetical protein
MRMLRGLELNCLLAPLLPSLLGIVGLWFLQSDWQQQTEKRLLDLLGSQLEQVISRLTAGETLGTVAAQQPTWQSLSLLRFETDGQVTILTHHGQMPQLRTDDPPPVLAEAVVLPRTWKSGLLCAAAPLLDADGHLRGIVYGEYQHAIPWNRDRLLVWIGGLAVLALALSWYLARRIYRPIRWLEADARAALEQRSSTEKPTHSMETADVSGSVEILVSRYRSQKAQEQG